MVVFLESLEKKEKRKKQTIQVTLVLTLLMAKNLVDLAEVESKKNFSN